VAHLVQAQDDQNGQLNNRPAQNLRADLLRRGPKLVLPIPLKVLLPGNALALLDHTTDVQLHLGQLFLLGHFLVVLRVLADFDLEVDAESLLVGLEDVEGGGGVGAHADEVLAGDVGGEGELAFGAVGTGENFFAVWVGDDYVHAEAGGGRYKVVHRVRPADLHRVVTLKNGLFRHFLDETFSFIAHQMEV